MGCTKCGLSRLAMCSYDRDCVCVMRVHEHLGIGRVRVEQRLIWSSKACAACTLRRMADVPAPHRVHHFPTQVLVLPNYASVDPSGEPPPVCPHSHRCQKQIPDLCHRCERCESRQAAIGCYWLLQRVRLYRAKAWPTPTPSRNDINTHELQNSFDHNLK